MINWGRSMPVVAQARSTAWKYILWFILDCCRVNAYLVYKEASSRTIRKCVAPTSILLLNFDVPWLVTLPPGRERVYENPWHLCLSKTTVLTVFLLLDGAKDAMRWISTKKLWLGVLPVTFTSVRTATSRGTELKTNRNQMSKCDWFRECDEIVIVIVISYFYL